MGATKVGKTLGNFRILDCLGSGGSGMIWKAEDLALGRIVALKALRPELAADDDMSQRFRAEARTLAKLSHANIASLYSLIEDDDGVFLVLEYVEGHTLAALLATSGPLPFDSAFALFHQVLDGIGHAHDAGVVHRDLKPTNLMVDARGRVKVMDFGIARVAGAARTTHHGKLVGTPEYMSPEQVRGEDATIRSDLYSLGIVLFEMLTGRPPFRGPASFELMRAQLEDAPPDPCSLRPGLDPRLAAAIARALAKRPAERFATARELQETLLDAGAARRGRQIAPVWQDLQPAAGASETPTLLTSPPFWRANRDGAETRRVRAPESDRGNEPFEDWKRAVDAIDGDIDAAFAAVSPARARASQTAVMDPTQETALLELARPTRMLDDAPFAAHAQSLSAKADQDAGAEGSIGVVWALAAAALITFAFGTVRLRSAAEDEKEASSRTPVAETEPSPPRNTAPLPSPPAAAGALRTNAAPKVVAERAPSAPPRRARRDPARKAPAKNAAPAADPGEETGWVIRR